MNMNVATSSPKAKHPNILASILWALLLTQSPAYADYASYEKIAIKKVKTTLTSEIEKGRPAIPFEVWLQNLAGKDAKMKWELNDCGEGTGGPADRERDMPLCVGVRADLPDGRYLDAELGVASGSDFDRGVMPSGVGVRDVYAGYKDETLASGSGLDSGGALIRLEEFMKVDGRSISLYFAAAKGDVQTAQSMLKQGVDLHSGYGAKAIFVAAGNGQLPMVRLLLDSGVDVNSRMGDESVLSYTTRWRGQYYPAAKVENSASSGYVVDWNSYFEVVQLLVARGADAFSKDKGLSYAAGRQHDASRQLDIVRFLIKAGADVNGTRNPLLSAAGQSNVEVIRVLLDAGADVRAVPYVLTECVKEGSKEGLLFLIEHGANVRPNNGDPPLIAAVDEGVLEKARILIDHGADINAPARITYFTPLIEAALNGRLEMAKLLIEKGADVNRRSLYGVTALSLATQKNHSDIAKLLKNAGAKQ